MEIEAKFIVPTRALAQKLRAVECMADLTCGAPKYVEIRDTFFDTHARDLIRARHVLRFRRSSDGRALLTLKAPAKQKGAVHARPEIEVEVSHARTPRILAVEALPARIRKLVTPLVTAMELYPLFSISQTREVKTIRRARETIAEWSLDYVKFRSGERQEAFYELEIELKKTGTRQDLEKMVAWVEEEYRLLPMTESKFARGLRFTSGST